MRSSTILFLAAALLVPAAFAQTDAVRQLRESDAACRATSNLRSGDFTLNALVAPDTVIENDGKPLLFALHAFIEFRTLRELFSYIDSQTGRWKFATPQARADFANDLLRRGVESRVVSMLSEKPLDELLTHTSAELRAAIACLPAKLYAGQNWSLDRAVYGAAFERVRDRWSHGVNCWSSSSLLAGRVLSNWYLIDEGIELYGARYDSTEHFWQAVKYHPSVKVADLLPLLAALQRVDWNAWLARVDRDQDLYLKNAYAVEFLRANLRPEHRAWFVEQLNAQPMEIGVRALQQRGPAGLRFTAFQEKVLWGDLADVFHLLVYFDATAAIGDAPLLAALRTQHFDGVYLGDKKFGFISPEFRALMLEIWKVKYLKMARFGDVIRSIPREWKLEHFLNDGDSPDIPIPVYIGQLNEIRRQAWAAAPR
jgi:hypothetical protein